MEDNKIITAETKENITTMETQEFYKDLLMEQQEQM